MNKEEKMIKALQVWVGCLYKVIAQETDVETFTKIVHRVDLLKKIEGDGNGS